MTNNLTDEESQTDYTPMIYQIGGPEQNKYRYAISRGFNDEAVQAQFREGEFIDCVMTLEGYFNGNVVLLPDTEVERLRREREGGIGLIARERRRQIEEEGWTPEHDDEHVEDELAQAATCYALGDSRISNITAEYFIDIWPSGWGREWGTIKKKSRLRQLVIAGALIAAEIERLQRRAATTQSDSDKG